MQRSLQHLFVVLALFFPGQALGQLIPETVEHSENFINGAVNTSTTKISSLTTTVYEAFEDVVEFLEETVDFGEILVDNWDQVQPELAFSLLVISAILVFGLFAERLAWGLFSGTRRRLAAASDGKMFPLMYNLAAVIVDILRFLVFVGVAMGVLYYADVGGTLHIVASQLIWVTTLFLGFLVLWRATLAPNISQLRLMPLEDKSALEVYRWGRSVSMLGLYGYWVAFTLSVSGVPDSFDDALLGFIGFIIVIRCTAFILHWREPLMSWMLAQAPKKRDLGIIPMIAHIWHVVAILYVIALYYFFITSGGEDIWSALGVAFYTAFIAFLTVGAISAVPPLVQRLFQLVRDMDKSKLLEGMPALQSVSTLVVQLLVLIIGVSLIGPAWDLDILDHVGIGERKTAVITVVDVGIILMISVALWDFSYPFVGLFLRKISQNGPKKPGQKKRIETLHPLLAAS
ncbi:MAG: hypothetical protein GY915_00990 [bacterium]|nr:hypothetical protein [bacterium]